MYFGKTWALQEERKKKKQPYIYLCSTSENSEGPRVEAGVYLNKGRKSFTDCSGVWTVVLKVWKKLAGKGKTSGTSSGYFALGARHTPSECHQRCLVWACVCAQGGRQGLLGWIQMYRGFLVLYQNSSVASTETPSWTHLSVLRKYVFSALEQSFSFLPSCLCLSVSLPPCFSPLTPFCPPTPFLRRLFHSPPVLGWLASSRAGPKLHKSHHHCPLSVSL